MQERLTGERGPDGLRLRPPCKRVLQRHALERLVEARREEALPTGNGVAVPRAHPRLARERREGREGLPLGGDIRAEREVLESRGGEGDRIGIREDEARLRHPRVLELPELRPTAPGRPDEDLPQCREPGGRPPRFAVRTLPGAKPRHAQWHPRMRGARAHQAAEGFCAGRVDDRLRRDGLRAPKGLSVPCCTQERQRVHRGSEVRRPTATPHGERPQQLTTVESGAARVLWPEGGAGEARRAERLHVTTEVRGREVHEVTGRRAPPRQREALGMRDRRLPEDAEERLTHRRGDPAGLAGAEDHEANLP